jgi:3-oxoadipate enol-lactonase
VAVIAPPIAERRSVVLPAGTVVLRELAGPPGAPTVMLLHGLGVTADINFFRCYRILGERYRVLAFDHRGHGEGLRSRRPFRLSDCADDVVAMADVLGIDRFIPVGYSMGGAVAQYVWRRHPRRVSGVVLCATASTFNTTVTEQRNYLTLGGLAALARLTPPALQRSIVERYRRDRHADWAQWARDQSSRADWRAVLEAAAAIGRFHSDSWISGLDVPAAMVVTTHDSTVPASRQRQLAALLPDAVVFSVDAGHDAVVAAPGFAGVLVAAIDSVVARAS